MSLTVALSTLRTNVRNRGELRAVPFPDAEVTAMINASLKQLHWLIHSWNQDYFTTFRCYDVVASPTTGTGDSLTVAAGIVTLADSAAAFSALIPERMITIAGATNALNNGCFPIVTRPTATSLTFKNALGVTQASWGGTYSIENNRFALPDDFWQANGCDVLDSDGSWSNIRRFNRGERNLLQSTAGIRRGMRYRIEKNSLFVMPVPSWSATASLRLWYVPTPTVLASDTDTWDTVAGFDEWVVLNCCVMAAAKEGTDPAAFMAQLAKCESMIKLVVGRRDVGEGDCIRDVYEERNDLLEEPDYWRP